MPDLDALRYFTAYIKTQSLSDAEADRIAALWSLALEVVEAADVAWNKIGDLLEAVGDMPSDPSECWSEWTPAQDAYSKLSAALARFKEQTDG